MSGFPLYCTLTFGTSLDPRINKHKKNKLKHYKENKRKRLQDGLNTDTAVAETTDSKFISQIKIECSDSDSQSSDSDLDSNEQNVKVKSLPKKNPSTLSVLKLAQLRREEVSHIRRVNQIHVIGSDIPDPIETFNQLKTEFDVNSNLLENIYELGFSTPTPIQMQAIPLLLYERNTLASAPTGSGKTAAFLIPLIHHLKEHKKIGFRVLILAPTRELVKQIFSVCDHLCKDSKLKPLIIEDVKSAIENPKSLKKNDILISTPNRLVYMIRHDPPCLCLKSVQWLIVDECDKLFETANGENSLREQLATIYKACDSVNLKRALFSATFSHDVEEWCKLNFDSVVTVSIGNRNTAVETIKQELLFVGSEGGKLLAIRDVLKRGTMPPILVFVQSKQRAQELFQELTQDNLRVEVTHSDLPQNVRNLIIQKFMAGKIWVLICTELLSRGIDFSGVNLVINYDFPPTATSYIHRIGRTGRAGQQGHAITFFADEDKANLRSIAQVMKNAGCDVPEYILQMKKKKRKEQTQRVIKRESISTIPFYDLNKKETKQHTKKTRPTKRKREKPQKDA